MMMKNLWKGLFLMTLTLVFVSCSKNDDAGNTDQGTANLSVKLVDAPGDYDAVYIDVQDVMVKYNGETDEVSIGEINAGVYNLLELTGGVSAVLVDDQLPAGSISQIRLVLGSQNSVVVDGQSYPLDTPSAQQSGLKLQLHQDLEEDVYYEYVLDFDVDQSIVVQGNGGYSLHPSIQASLVANAGKISGAVLPLGFQTLVTADNGTTVVSAYTDAQGNYMLYGLPEGAYNLTFEADATLGVPPITLSGVNVTAGVTTTVETVTFL